MRRKRKSPEGDFQASLPSKYRNKFEIVDGIKFRSKAEARRYSELKLLERAGGINGLKLQVRYPLNVDGVHVGTYTADFTYTEIINKPHSVGQRFVVEDVKGHRTRDYILKKKLMKALYRYDVQEVEANGR